MKNLYTYGINRGDFSFDLGTFNRWAVTYTSPNTGKQWTSQIRRSDWLMDIRSSVDAECLRKDLKELKRICKECWK